jgi:hypothetical protein
MNPGTDWMEQGRRLLETLRTATGAPDGEHGSDCRWCPICQAAAVVRGERPEVTEALADLLSTAAAALRTFAESGGTSSEPQVQEPEGDEAPPVQQIDIA